MREIKFRAWDSKAKVMYQDVSILSMKARSTLLIDGDSVHIRPDSPKCTLMQYTGLKDKNGVEIYEGDIFVVRSLHDGDEYVWNQTRHNEGGEGAIPQEVEWDEKLCRFQFGDSTRILYNPYDFEVIGNIYENKELLK